MPQKSSKHFLISIFFPCPTPRSVLRASNNEDLFCLQFCSYKCVLSIFIYNIALQNTDFGVLQKSSKHFLISIFFQVGRGDTPLPDPPPARHFVPRTRASPLSMTIHAPPSTKSWIRHCNDQYANSFAGIIRNVYNILDINSVFFIKRRTCYSGGNSMLHVMIFHVTEWTTPMLHVPPIPNVGILVIVYLHHSRIHWTGLSDNTDNQGSSMFHSYMYLYQIDAC